MKKNIVVLLVSLFVASALNAQGIDLGAKAGYLYSKMEPKGLENWKAEPKSGYFLGAFARISGKTVFFQPELVYRARTSDFKFQDLANSLVTKNEEIAVEYKTLDIPLQVGVTVLDLAVVKLAIHAGPVFSFNLTKDTELKNIPDKLKEISKNSKTYIKDYKDFVYSGQVGISADVARFVFDLSYEKGLSDISEKGVGKNDLFIATVGIKLF